MPTKVFAPVALSAVLILGACGSDDGPDESPQAVAREMVDFMAAGEPAACDRISAELSDRLSEFEGGCPALFGELPGLASRLYGGADQRDEHMASDVNVFFDELEVVDESDDEIVLEGPELRAGKPQGTAQLVLVVEDGEWKLDDFPWKDPLLEGR